MKTETALVWTQSGVELHTVTTVDLWLEFVVFPNNTELDDTLWNGNHGESSSVFGLLFEEGRVLEGGDQLCSGNIVSSGR